MTIRVAAIVPMRHSSERVHGKNYRLFAGRPLYHHIVATLLSCPEIGSVIIDTDSDVILSDASKHFPSVQLVRRPEHLRDGMTSMNQVLLNSVNQTDAEYFLQTHSTNPLLKTDTISAAIDAFTKGAEHHDSLFSVSRLQARMWNFRSQPINHDPSVLQRTQDLDPVFEENSCIYLFSKRSLLANGNRIGSRPMMFELDRMEAQDIDVEMDFRIAEALFLNERLRGKP